MYACRVDCWSDSAQRGERRNRVSGVLMLLSIRCFRFSRGASDDSRAIVRTIEPRQATQRLRQGGLGFRRDSVCGPHVEWRVLVENGNWIGRGSWLHETESSATKFTIALSVQTTYSGSEIRAEIETKDGKHLQVTGESFVSGTGLYEFLVRTPKFALTGISKLESLPHLALFWSEDESWQACVTVFAIRKLHGVRGFLRSRKDTFTFEVALEKQDQAEPAANIVRFDPNRGKP